MSHTNNQPMMDRLGEAIAAGDFASVKSICPGPPKEFNINAVFENYLSGVEGGKQGKGQTAVNFAFQKHQNKIAKYLLNRCGADAAAEGKKGTSLMTAVKVLNKEGVAILLEIDVVNDEIRSCNKSSSPLYELQKMYGNATHVAKQKRIISLAEDLVKHGANTECLEADDFRKKILRTAGTTTPIYDLTSMSPTAAQQSLERSSHELLEPTGNGTTGGDSTLTPGGAGSSTASPNHSMQNAIDNGTTVGNNTSIPSGNGSYAEFTNHSILSSTGNDTIGVNRSDIPEVIYSFDNTGLLISVMGGMVLTALGVVGSYFAIKKYKENKNYTKAMEGFSYDPAKL